MSDLELSSLVKYGVAQQDLVGSQILQDLDNIELSSEVLISKLVDLAQLFLLLPSGADARTNQVGEEQVEAVEVGDYNVPVPSMELILAILPFDLQFLKILVLVEFGLFLEEVILLSVGNVQFLAGLNIKGVFRNGE